jgi:hypothetical protein
MNHEIDVFICGIGITAYIQIEIDQNYRSNNEYDYNDLLQLLALMKYAKISAIILIGKYRITASIIIIETKIETAALSNEIIPSGP